MFYLQKFNNFCKFAIMDSRGIEDQIRSGEYTKTTEGATLKDFRDMVESLYSKNKPTEENQMVFVMDGYTIKNIGSGLFILCEDDTFIPCEIDQITKRIKIL